MHHFGNICIHSICCVTETRQEEIKANQGRNWVMTDASCFIAEIAFLQLFRFYITITQQTGGDICYCEAYMCEILKDIGYQKQSVNINVNL